MAQTPSKPKEASKPASANKLSYEEQKAQARQRQKWEREVKAAEEEIVQLEAAIAVLESQMATPEGSQDMSLYEKHSKFKKQLSDAEERWAEALEKV